MQIWGVADYLGVRPKFWLFRGDKDADSTEKIMQREEDEENLAADSVSHITQSELGINRRTAGAPI